MMCQTCAKIKNACQCCVLDLEFQLPTRIRDSVLESHSGMPTTDVNTQVYVRKMEQQMGDSAVVNHGKAESAAKEVLRKLSKGASQPYNKYSTGSASRTPICPFYIKGNCKRDLDCPLRHEFQQSNNFKKKTPKRNNHQETSRKEEADLDEETQELIPPTIQRPILQPPPPPGEGNGPLYPSQRMKAT